MWNSIKVFTVTLLVFPLQLGLCLDVGESLDSALSENAFDYFVQLKASDLEYEVDVHYSFLLHVIKTYHDGISNDSIGRQVSFLESIHKEWLSEVEKLKELERLHEKLIIIKFVLAEDSDVKKQGLLVVDHGTIIRILWDDGIMFYNGVTLNIKLGTEKDETGTGMTQGHR